MKEKRILLDGVNSVGVHNGIVRVRFFQLLANGQTETVVELQIPLNQIKAIIEALTKIGK